MKYNDWFETKIINGNELEDGFIEEHRVEFDKFCKEEFEKEVKDGVR